MKDKRPSNDAKFAAREILPKSLLKLAADSDTLWAASPYVTDTRLYKDSNGSDQKLYTSFDAMNFISGASSIKTLRKLLSQSVQLYQVVDLHAKVILIDHQHFALGSQNLTYKGRRNIEVNAISGRFTSAKEISKFFAYLHSKSNPILESDLDDMESLVAPSLRKFEQFRNYANKINRQIADNRFKRIKEFNKKRLLERIRQRQEERRRQDQLKSHINTALEQLDIPTSSSVITHCKTFTVIP